MHHPSHLVGAAEPSDGDFRADLVEDLLGHALEQEGDLNSAIAEYKRALWFKPTQEQTHIFLGGALAKQKKHEQAAAHYLAALKLNPESAVAHNNLARVLQTQNRLDEAIEHYLAALKLDPGLAGWPSVRMGFSSI